MEQKAARRHERQGAMRRKKTPPAAARLAFQRSARAKLIPVPALSMNTPVVDDYGWASARASHSCAYLTPRILTILQGLKLRRVLDLGAGNGSLCVALARAGFDVVGMEYDPRGVEIARRQSPQIPMHQLGVQDSPATLLASEAPFDAVVSTEVIEHLYAPHLLPQFARQVLKESGALVISTPYHGYGKNLALALFNHWDTHHAPLWHGGHIKFFSRATLTKLISDAGFDVTDFVGAGRCPYLWKSMILVGRKEPTGNETEQILATEDTEG